MTYYPPQAYAAQTTSEANNYASYEPAAFEGVQHHNQPQHDQQLDQHQLQHQKVAPVKPKRKYSSAKKEQQLAAIPESHLAFGEDCESERKRRNQVKVACIHCKRACKKCDDVRPCGRCVRIGQADTCEDAPRKERSKGKSRGPYNKKRDGSEKHSPEGTLGEGTCNF